MCGAALSAVGIAASDLQRADMFLLARVMARSPLLVRCSTKGRHKTDNIRHEIIWVMYTAPKYFSDYFVARTFSLTSSHPFYSSLDHTLHGRCAQVVQVRQS